MHYFIQFLSTFASVALSTGWLRPPLRLSVRIISAPTGPILVKFDGGGFYDNLSRTPKPS